MLLGLLLHLSFAVNAWAAFAPGVSSRSEWRHWAQAPFVFSGEAMLELSTVPAMMRRRLSALGRMAVAAADSVMLDVDGTQHTHMPIVWASRYGDAKRALELLADQAQSQPLSPTAFGLSVHNGIGAQHSIARSIMDNAVCVASGVHTAEAGMVEALALLHDGAPEVLLVCYDAPLPGSYATFHDEPVAEYAWAVRVSLESLSPGAMRFSLSNAGGSEEVVALHTDGCALPHGLTVLQYMLSGREVLESRCAGQFWQWRRSHG